MDKTLTSSLLQNCLEILWGILTAICIYWNQQKVVYTSDGHWTKHHRWKVKWEKVFLWDPSWDWSQAFDFNSGTFSAIFCRLSLNFYNSSCIVSFTPTGISVWVILIIGCWSLTRLKLKTFRKNTLTYNWPWLSLHSIRYRQSQKHVNILNPKFLLVVTLK